MDDPEQIPVYTMLKSAAAQELLEEVTQNFVLWIERWAIYIAPSPIQTKDDCLGSYQQGTPV